MRAQKREKVSDRPKERKENICAHIKYSSANNLSNNNNVMTTDYYKEYIYCVLVHTFIHI